MKFSETTLAGAYSIELSPFYDDRGWFARTFSKDEFKNIGFAGEWVQMNHSFTAKAGTIRGMHYQLPPYREIKMVRCISGEVFDVIVDVRTGSPTFLQWFGIKLSPSGMNMIYIPEGFAHGFQALTDGCELIYLHSEFYTPGYEAGIGYNDPLVNIKWPLNVTKISDRDNNHPGLTESFKGI
jgi:dTDP-4-dehydrorhamnose 3,5-epimerase